MISVPKNLRQFALLALPVMLVGGGLAYAQIEGPQRGIKPIASTGDFEVSGIEVNVTGKDAFEARQKGWEEAQRLGWTKLYAQMRGGAKSELSDGTLDGIVSAIVVEEEQIGPRRYVAKLGVVFDRARAGQLLGVKGVMTHSAPLLLLPVTMTGGAPTLYEQRTAWQASWAKFKTADSRIDYVRPSGAGGESLLLNAGQLDRRSRIWWRVILDQFGAADVLTPIARIERQWPGGPVIGHFTARYGPDNKFLGSFTLTAPNSKALPKMMDEAVVRMDRLFQTALAEGRLRADASLVLDEEVIQEEDLEAPEEELTAPEPTLDAAVQQIIDDVDGADQPTTGPAPVGPTQPAQGQPKATLPTPSPVTKSPAPTTKAPAPTTKAPATPNKAPATTKISSAETTPASLFSVILSYSWNMLRLAWAMPAGR